MWTFTVNYKFVYQFINNLHWISALHMSYAIYKFPIMANLNAYICDRDLGATFEVVL